MIYQLAHVLTGGEWVGAYVWVVAERPELLVAIHPHDENGKVIGPLKAFKTNLQRSVTLKDEWVGIKSLVVAAAHVELLPFFGQPPVVSFDDWMKYAFDRDMVMDMATMVWDTAPNPS